MVLPSTRLQKSNPHSSDNYIQDLLLFPYRGLIPSTFLTYRPVLHDPSHLLRVISPIVSVVSRVPATYSSTVSRNYSSSFSFGNLLLSNL